MLPVSVFLALLETEEEKKSFTILYEEYKNLMYHIANNILNDTSISEDCVHKAFLVIMKHASDFDVIKCDKTKNFVCKVVKNCAIDEYRKRKARFHKIVELDDIDVASCSAELRQIENEQDLSNILELLPDKYSDILQFIIVYQFTYRQAARQLSITEATARKRYERAIKLLRAILEKEGVTLDD